MENGYAICMNQWALDKDIKNELGLLLIISSLCAEKGYCYASNKYFTELFNIPEENISRKIKKLEEKGYITIEYEKVGCQIKKRYIRLTKISTVDCQKYQSTIDENVKENIISNNITNINNIYKDTKKKAYGKYKRIKLQDQEYNKLVETYGKEYIDEQIQSLDNYVESNNNKNKYSNFYLVLLKSIKGDWFKNKTKQLPEWFNQEIKNKEATPEEKQYMEDLLKSL